MLDQLPRLNRILALKDLGLSLEEITRMVDRQVRPDEIRSILTSQQTELEQEIQEAQRRFFPVDICCAEYTISIRISFGGQPDDVRKTQGSEQ